MPVDASCFPFGFSRNKTTSVICVERRWLFGPALGTGLRPFSVLMICRFGEIVVQFRDSNSTGLFDLCQEFCETAHTTTLLDMFYKRSIL